MTSPRKLDYRMIPEQAEEGLRMLGNNIYNYLHGKKEATDIKTTESKSGGVTNIINNYPTGKSTRFGFFSTVGVIVTMILCGSALAIGWTLITKPELILNWFGI